MLFTSIIFIYFLNENCYYYLYTRRKKNVRLLDANTAGDIQRFMQQLQQCSYYNEHNHSHTYCKLLKLQAMSAFIMWQNNWPSIIKPIVHKESGCRIFRVLAQFTCCNNNDNPSLLPVHVSIVLILFHWPSHCYYQIFFFHFISFMGLY